ncbi:MAG TPA: hypothetical protein VEB42_12855 [Chitinophagaceae bacterium]|nr:hypothetical protein [Chitinophagaceae bacterium]
MKIRMQANSLRYRLQQDEVADFEKHGKITEVIRLGPGTDEGLCFALQVSSTSDVTVQHAGNTITIEVPEQIASQWTNTAMIGFDAIIKNNDGDLKVLVEKDFN